MTSAHSCLLNNWLLIIGQHLVLNIFHYIILDWILCIRIILLHLIHLSLTHPVWLELSNKYASISQPYLPLPLSLRLLHLCRIDLLPDHISIDLQWFDIAWVTMREKHGLIVAICRSAIQHVAVRPAPAFSINASEGALVELACSENTYSLKGKHLIIFVLIVKVGGSVKFTLIQCAHLESNFYFRNLFYISRWTPLLIRMHHRMFEIFLEL